jgi:hypothetical protein
VTPLALTRFDLVYPEWIQALSESHWTPEPIARAVKLESLPPVKRQ